MPKQPLFILFLTSMLLGGCNAQQKNPSQTMPPTKNPVYSRTDSSKLNLSEAEWQQILPPDVYEIARQKGTERPFTGIYNKHKEAGTYHCAACGNALFTSDGKFESSCGWPSFFEPVRKGSIIYAPDHSHGMNRTEVMCGRCRAHLGHVFEDGPPPTGLRYCINSVVLDFEKKSSNTTSNEQ